MEGYIRNVANYGLTGLASASTGGKEGTAMRL